MKLFNSFIINNVSCYEQIWINMNNYEVLLKSDEIGLKWRILLGSLLQDSAENNEYLRDRWDIFLGIKFFITHRKRVKNTRNKYTKIKVCSCRVPSSFTIFMSRWLMLIPNFSCAGRYFKNQFLHKIWNATTRDQDANFTLEKALRSLGKWW